LLAVRQLARGGAALRAKSTAFLGLVVFFQWEFGNGFPVLVHYGHLPIRKPEREQAVRAELFGNLPGTLAGRLHIWEIKASFDNDNRVVRKFDFELWHAERATRTVATKLRKLQI
jgi:hypothetical protein